MQKDAEYDSKQIYDDADCEIFETNIQENLEDQFVQEALSKVIYKLCFFLFNYLNIFLI